MVRQYDRKLMFEDGTEYPGWAFGAEAEKVCEIVFNTSMVGYQEILSDGTMDSCESCAFTGNNLSADRVSAAWYKF